MNKAREWIFEDLKTLAKILPEQRIGQIIFNYVCAKCPNQDPFFISDDELLIILDKITKEIQEKQKQREMKKLLEENPNLIEEIIEMIKKSKQ